MRNLGSMRNFILSVAVALLGPFALTLAAAPADAAGTSGGCDSVINNRWFSVTCDTKREYRPKVACRVNYWWGHLDATRYGPWVTNGKRSTAYCPTGAEGTLYLVIGRTIQTRVP